MWPKYWNFSFSISPSNEYSGLISFRIDWFDLLAVQGTVDVLKGLGDTDGGHTVKKFTQPVDFQSYFPDSAVFIVVMLVGNIYYLP